MKDLDQIATKFTVLSSADLASYEGGKEGPGFNININISWANIRDTLKGFGDAVTGHPHHY